MIAEYDWDFNTALHIARCESNLNPKALNNNPQTRDYSVGIFQINLYGSLKDARPSEEMLYDPAFNVSYAYQIYQKQGWNAWRNCFVSYKQLAYSQ